MKKISHLSLGFSHWLKTLKQQQKGFTMIELLLYMGIFPILLIVLLQIFSSILSVHAESQATSSVDEDSTYILNRLTYDIHRASDITWPAPLGASDSQLKLTINGVEESYEIEKINNEDKLVITDNAGTEPISSGDTTAEVVFTTIGNSDAGSKPSVQIQLTVTSTTVRDGQRYQSDTYQTTVQTR